MEKINYDIVKELLEIGARMYGTHFEQDRVVLSDAADVIKELSDKKENQNEKVCSKIGKQALERTINYYVSAITDSGFVGYVYQLDYELNTKENFEKLTDSLSKEKGNAVILFFKRLN